MATSSQQQLEKLITMRTGWDYTPKTAEQIKAQAEGEYQSYYDQLRLAAQQAQAQSDLRLAQQASSLQAAYDTQREESQRQYQRAYSQADRQLLSRGMQRSSYGNSTLANINTESSRAQDKIYQAQIAAQSNIEEQRTQLQQQLARQMSQYTASQQADIMKRSRELEDIEYNRQVDAWKSQMSLEQMLYQAARQQERDAVADQQWADQMAENQRQFDQQLEYNYYAADKKGGGGGGSKKTTEIPTVPTNVDPATGLPYGIMPQNTFFSTLDGLGLGNNNNTLGVGSGNNSKLPNFNQVSKMNVYTADPNKKTDTTISSAKNAILAAANAVNKNIKNTNTTTTKTAIKKGKFNQ